ncbi:MAG: 2-amino-4-hydroxy-6-hydroxymethyldihydropteridine diphosphokinase [Planctomycetaceae bacterium]
MNPGGFNRAYLLLGSNMDAETNLPAAVRALSAFGTIVAASGVRESAPVGFTQQDNFLNAAVLLETESSAVELREGPIAAVERQLHRVRDPQNVDGPRTIDIDIVLFNDDVGEFGRVRVPDPDLLTRAFVAVPLAEIAPAFVHPRDGRTLAEIAADLVEDAGGLTPRPDVRLTVAG